MILGEGKYHSNAGLDFCRNGGGTEIVCLVTRHMRSQTSLRQEERGRGWPHSVPHAPTQLSFSSQPNGPPSILKPLVEWGGDPPKLVRMDSCIRVVHVVSSPQPLSAAARRSGRVIVDGENSRTRHLDKVVVSIRPATSHGFTLKIVYSAFIPSY